MSGPPDALSISVRPTVTHARDGAFEAYKEEANRLEGEIVALFAALEQAKDEHRALTKIIAGLADRRRIRRPRDR